MIRGLVLLGLIGVLVAAAAPALAQQETLEIQNVDESDYPTVELTVAVPTQVRDTLPPDAFAISENGEPRGRPSLGQAAGDAREPTAPRVVLAIDVSGSMAGTPIEQARAAAADFARSLRTGSEIAVVTFGDRPEVVTPFTSEIATVLDDLSAITADPTAETALHDGVARANAILQRGQSDGPQSIVVLADGDDSASRRSLDDVLAKVEVSGAALRAVGLEGDDYNPDTLATLAGGEDEVLSAGDSGELSEIYVSLASDLSRQYLLRYDSEATGDTVIGVDLAYGGISASTAIETTFEGMPAQPDEPVTRIASPDPFTVTVPPLGTTTAFGLGLGALLAAAALTISLIARAPVTSAGRRRLLPSPTLQQRPGLTVVAEWVTEQAERRLRDRQLGGAIDRMLESAGVDLRTGEFVVGVLSMMVVAYAVGLTIANYVLGIAFALTVPISARIMLGIRRDKRQAAFAEQFIDVLQLLAGSLRAGYGLLQGIDAVSRDAQEPASAEFRRILIEHRLGRDLAEAMDNCAARMNNTDFIWVVQAIGIHREVGGDLARVLDNIVDTVRERAAVRRQVRALSVEGRMSAWVLTALPFVTLLAIQIVSPDYLSQMTSRPIGWMLVGIAGVMLLVGSIVIRRLVNIEY